MVRASLRFSRIELNAQAEERAYFTWRTLALMSSDAMIHNFSKELRISLMASAEQYAGETLGFEKKGTALLFRDKGNFFPLSYEHIISTPA